VPLTGRRHYLDALAWQIGWQSAPTGMTPPAQCTFGGFVPLYFVGGFGLYWSRRRGLQRQHALLDYRHAFLATPAEQPMRQQLHPLAQRRVLLVEPFDLVAEFVEDCLSLCAACRRHVPPPPAALITTGGK